MDLHSTIFILKPKFFPILSANNFEFTFYNIYIKTTSGEISFVAETTFTFYNIYIKTCMEKKEWVLSINLHSTIFILKLSPML